MTRLPPALLRGGTRECADRYLRACLLPVPTASSAFYDDSTALLTSAEIHRRTFRTSELIPRPIRRSPADTMYIQRTNRNSILTSPRLTPPEMDHHGATRTEIGVPNPIVRRFCPNMEMAYDAAVYHTVKRKNIARSGGPDTSSRSERRSPSFDLSASSNDGIPLHCNTCI